MDNDRVYVPKIGDISNIKRMLGMSPRSNRRDIARWVGDTYDDYDDTKTQDYEPLKIHAGVYKYLEQTLSKINKAYKILLDNQEGFESSDIDRFVKDIHFIEKYIKVLIERYSRHIQKNYSLTAQQKALHTEAMKNLDVLPHGPETTVPATYPGSKTYWNAFRNSVLPPSKENKKRAKQLVKESKRRHRESASEFINMYDDEIREKRKRSI